MPRDYRRIHDALTRKAHDRATGVEEAAALLARAALLRERHPEAFEANPPGFEANPFESSKPDVPPPGADGLAPRRGFNPADYRQNPFGQEPRRTADAWWDGNRWVTVSANNPGNGTTSTGNVNVRLTGSFRFRTQNR